MATLDELTEQEQAALHQLRVAPVIVDTAEADVLAGCRRLQLRRLVEPVRIGVEPAGLPQPLQMLFAIFVQPLEGYQLTDAGKALAAEDERGPDAP